MYFDSHAHYDFEPFDGDRDKILKEILPAAGVSRVLNIGTNMGSCAASVALAQQYEYIYASVGVHPHNAIKINDTDINKLADMTLEPKVVAIGEIGLDYHYNFSPPDVQLKRFKQQLELAIDLQMPVIIHCREAHDDMLEILTSYRAGELTGGVLHCFSGDVAIAQKYLNLGWHLGIGGVVTYKNAQSLRDVVAAAPHDRILIETDCPYLTPEPNRGKRNDSTHLTAIANKIAEIWNINHDEVADITTKNTTRLFGVSL